MAGEQHLAFAPSVIATLLEQNEIFSASLFWENIQGTQAEGVTLREDILVFVYLESLYCKLFSP